MFGGVFSGKTVWLSGHTGFKGAWLAHWLLELGADVRGFSLPPPPGAALFNALGLAARMRGETADVRDREAVRRSIAQAQPDFVFHLAAQSLVRRSYADPVETFATNVSGTVHVLDALRALERPCVAVLVTTDKCYENREWIYGYRENDPLGGADPYSASKAAAEMAIAAYRRSFFKDHPVKIASARAGNVIGGGDWAEDRIVPDSVRALQAGQPIPIRNPQAVRPWQHVLEPLSGYLWLAARLALTADLRPLPSALCSAFNFGPGHDANRTVSDLVHAILMHWPGRSEDRHDPHAVHEASLLQLSTDKAHALLGWSPVWSFATAVERTVGWYRAAAAEVSSTSAGARTSNQIAAYVADARALGAPWA